VTSNSSIRQILHHSKRYQRSAGLVAVALALTTPTIVLLSPSTPVSAFSLPGIAPATDLPNGDVGGGSNQLDGLTVRTAIVSSTADGTGHYDVIYDVTVTNTSDTARRYDLIDTLRPGAGAVLSPPAIPTTTLADDRTLAPYSNSSDIDRYRLSARFVTDLDPSKAVANASSADCTVDRDETSGNTGLRRVVTLTSNGRSTSASSCTPFGHLSQSTRVVSSVPWGAANTTVTSETVISNDSGAPAAYSVSQAILGARTNGLVFATWTGPDGSGAFVVDGDSGDAVAEMTREQLLAPRSATVSGRDTYTVTALYDRSALFDPSALLDPSALPTAAGPDCLRTRSFLLTASHMIEAETCSPQDRFDLALGLDVATVNGVPTTPGGPGPGGAATVAVGDMVTFAIEIVNEGTVAATNIEIIDDVPDGYRFDAQPGWSRGPGGIVSDLIAGPLSPGSSVHRQITLIVTDLATDSPQRARRQLLNTARISQADNDSYILTPAPIDADALLDSTDQALISHDGANLGVAIIAAGTFVRSGAPTGFGITVTNTGPITVDDVSLSVDVPAGLRFDAVAGAGADAGWTGPPHGPVRRAIDSPAPGASDRYLLPLVAEPVDRAATSRTALAQPHGSGCAALDPDELNHPLMTLVELRYASTVVADDCDYARTQRFSLDVDLALSAVNDASLAPDEIRPLDLGDSVALSVGIANHGSMPVAGLAVSVAIPPGLAVVDQPGWTVNGSALTTETSSLVIPPGVSTTIATLTAFVIDLGDPIGGFTLTADVVAARSTLSAHPDDLPPSFDGGADRESETLLTRPPDVGVEDHLSGDDTGHEIEVVHLSGRPATNVVITDTLPSGYHLDPTLAAVAGWTGPPEGPARLVLARLGIGERRTLLLPLIAAGAPTGAPNSVSIAYDDAYLFENNEATAVRERSGLELDVTTVGVNHGPVMAVSGGDEVQLSIAVTNLGTTEVDGYELTARLGPGLDLLTDSPVNAGWSSRRGVPHHAASRALQPGGTQRFQLAVKVNRNAVESAGEDPSVTVEVSGADRTGGTAPASGRVVLDRANALASYSSAAASIRPSSGSTVQASSGR